MEKTRLTSWAAALFAVALTACTEQPSNGPPPPGPPAPAANAPAAAPANEVALQGEWVVGMVSDTPPPAGAPVIQVTITPDRIRAQSQCKPFWWTYVLTAGAFKATREPYPGPVCERTLSYWESAFEQAVDGASIAAPHDGGVLLRGPGGQVLLRRR